MKKVIFVGLLTLSVCLSQPTNTVNPTPAPHETTKAGAASPVPTVAPSSTATVDPKPNDTPHKSNETDTKPTTAAPSVTEKGKTDATTTTTAVPKPDTTTSTTAAPKPDTTTSTTTAAPITEKPKSTTEKPTATTGTPTLQARGFDGASFVGGIILTLGLLAIGFMGFKYYKAQTERNYHTL